MKLWQNSGKINKDVEAFTVGDDIAVDNMLLPYDIQGSIAHAKMLSKIKILSKSELAKIISCLNVIKGLHAQGKFKIMQSDEDMHAAIENYLTKKLGATGKKIHTCRSRNDQIATALRLYQKKKIKEIEKQVKEMIAALEKFSLKNKAAMPGYTHMQKAMPSSIHIWIYSYVAALKDDLILLATASKVINQNPLGSAAGYGLPIEIDRKYTAQLLGFKKIQQDLYVQNSRGKFEAIILDACEKIMYDISKLALDLLIFTMSEFNYFSLPDEFCTGSSIMPQKKNYDVFEIARGNYGLVLADNLAIKTIAKNLPSGYNRDLQLTKKPFIDAINITQETLTVMTMVIANLKVNKEHLQKAMSPELYEAEKALKLASKGMPFRDAYLYIKNRKAKL